MQITDAQYQQLRKQSQRRQRERSAAARREVKRIEAAAATLGLVAQTSYGRDLGGYRVSIFKFDPAKFGGAGEYVTSHNVHD